jgi:UDP-3-O-[3-hydroxymyristoyl] glucosamine N-acyltransferase
VSTASLGEIAVRFGCTLKGDPDVRVTRVATLERADEQSLTFLATARYRRLLSATKAAAVVLDAKFADECPVAALVSKNPYATYARIATLLHPAPAAAPGRHASAVIDPSARIDATASIGPHVVIGARARIGARCSIGPGCVILEDVMIGADTRLVASVTLCSSIAIGERCILHPGAVIGADGFGFAPDQGEWVKIPQVGSVQIGNDVEIGAGTTVDRGTINDTVIEDGVKLDNQIQIGHNVRVGAHTAMAAFAGVSGSTTIGKHCMIAGQVGIAGQLTICDNVVITGKSFVHASIRKPGYYSSALPVDDAAQFRKNAARFSRLDQLARQVRRLAAAAGQQDEPADEEPAKEKLRGEDE